MSEHEAFEALIKYVFRGTISCQEVIARISQDRTKGYREIVLLMSQKVVYPSFDSVEPLQGGRYGNTPIKRQAKTIM